MSSKCADRWRNCGVEPDAEIREIDAMEGEISPLPPNVSSIRNLISTLEMCHHKADRWVRNIIEAIGAGETDKGLGTRTRGRTHPAEIVWSNSCAALSLWCMGNPVEFVDVPIGDLPAPRLLAGLGERTPLKEWQVRKVIERVRSFINWPWCEGDRSAQYVWILECGSGYESAHHDECPVCYREHEDFWRATVDIIIHDTVDDEEATLSLATAIDLLMPCHWSFVENLGTTVGAIGGNLYPDRPVTACGRNIALSPLREHMRVISDTLRCVAGSAGTDEHADEEVLAILGRPDKTKRWLAASLGKTIRLQLGL